MSNNPVSFGSNQNEALHKTLNRNISKQRLDVQLALTLLGVFSVYGMRKAAYFATSPVINNVQEYYQIPLKMGSLCTEEFGVEPDVKWNVMRWNLPD